MVQKRSSNKGKRQPRVLLTRTYRAKIEGDTEASMSPIVTIRRGRIVVDGMRQRPRCPNCNTAVSSTWVNCEGCKAVINWE